MNEREVNVYKAKLAAKTGRFSEMVSAMKAVACLDVELTAEERNLLSISYKYLIDPVRSSWKIISSIEQKEKNKVAEEKLKLIRDHKDVVEKELRDICSDLLAVLERHLLPRSLRAEAGEREVFYYKMKGDYHRFLEEVATGSNKEKEKNAALSSYGFGERLMTKLPATHTLRLGLALNFAVFHYEIMKAPLRARGLATAALDAANAANAANAELDTRSEESYKDSTLIMQLLRDHLTRWPSDTQAESQDEEEEEDQDV